jgi:sirohydrochlorin cobaltochelatase
MMHFACRFWVAFVLVCLPAAASPAGAAAKPAIVLVAFDTGPGAADTYTYLTGKVRERFPDHEIRLAYPPGIGPEKLPDGQERELPDLGGTLADLKAAGAAQVAVQPLNVIPDAEWEKNSKACGDTPGLKIALGKPLLSSLADRKRLLDALAGDFPPNFKEHAVLLVGRGSTSTAGLRENLSLYTLILAKLRGKNVFFGVVEGQPPIKNALGALKRSEAGQVTIVPLQLVADDSFANVKLGDQESLKSTLLAAKPYDINLVTKGLGSNDGVIQIYLDHLAAALDTFVEKKKPEKKPKRGKK